MYSVRHAGGGGGGGLLPYMSNIGMCRPTGIIFEHFKSEIGCRIYLFCSYIGSAQSPSLRVYRTTECPQEGMVTSVCFRCNGIWGKKCASWAWEIKGQKEKGVAKCITSAVWHLHSSSGDGR